MPRNKNKKRAPVTQKSQEISSLDLDEIDKICKEIQQEENERSKRKRGFEKISKKDKDTVELNLDMKFNTDRNLIEKAVPMVIQHLNKFGVCVIDDFLGKERGEDIMIEVKGLQQLLRDGQTGGSGEVSHEYRSDRIVWTDGIHPHSPNLRELISTLDSVVVAANKSVDNGSLGQYDISGRTNAMVACYPGEGTHYVKHVDNPGGDGRCITAIYYLNKNWRPERDGGALKIYSAYMNGAVATVDPLFDRVIFFWSDRRNPHAVMPAFRERFAITVWYLDKNEKSTFDEKK